MMEDTDTVDVEPDPDGNSTHYYPYYYDEHWVGDHLEDSGQIHNSTTKPPLIPGVQAASVPDVSEVNVDKVESYYPVFIFLGLVLVLGILCNLVVCYIYRCRSRRATSNFFVIFFAISDLVCCILGCVAELLDLVMPYTYRVKTLCQLTAYLKSFLVCHLPLTLVCVAYDCYRKVCRPGDEFGVKKAGFYCGISSVVALLLSIPGFSNYGIIQVTTEHPDVIGAACARDSNTPQWLNILHYGCILFPTFLFSWVATPIFYGLIVIYICRKRQAEERGENPSPLKREFPKKHTFVSKEDISSSSVSYNDELRRLPSQTSSSHSSKPIYTDPARVPLKGSASVTIKKTNSMQATSNSGNVPIIPLHVKNTRQASMFFIISALFIILMLPYAIITLLNAATQVFKTPLGYDTEIALNFMIRSYLLNFFTKPVVYLIFNVNFRKEVKHLFRKMLALCLRSHPSDSSSLPTQSQSQRTVSPQTSSSRNLPTRYDRRAKVEMSSIQKPRERWRWN